jgi:ABC-type multidrug transport system ATPase subunit
MVLPAIEVEHVFKRFERPLPRLRQLFGRAGPAAVDALRDVSLRVEAEEIFGLVGRNGQGKTTLIKTSCGLIEPSAGRVRIFGFDSVRDLREVKRRVGLVSADERSFYYRLTGRENLTFFARLHSFSEREIAERITTLARTFELEPVLERRFQEYSTGNKQRLAIARALLPDPPLLMLDEPTRSLDPISAEGLRRALRAWARPGAGRTVLITTHNLSEIEQLCERVAILSRGSVIECATLAELRAKYAQRERVELAIVGPIGAALLERWRAELGVVDHRREASGVNTVSLEREPGDQRLQRLLESVLAAKLTVIGCDTQHFGLMQVLEQIETRASAS